ncbi:MAG TPA: hypothetical protein VFT74_09930 [Isosphaeraceae bacterium]|nr:hypothetical protein [Isosphaeraceae bacterium]
MIRYSQYQDPQGWSFPGSGNPQGTRSPWDQSRVELGPTKDGPFFGRQEVNTPFHILPAPDSGSFQWAPAPDPRRSVFFGGDGTQPAGTIHILPYPYPIRPRPVYQPWGYQPRPVAETPQVASFDFDTTEVQSVMREAGTVVNIGGKEEVSVTEDQLNEYLATKAPLDSSQYQIAEMLKRNIKIIGHAESMSTATLGAPVRTTWVISSGAFGDDIGRVAQRDGDISGFTSNDVLSDYQAKQGGNRNNVFWALGQLSG